MHVVTLLLCRDLTATSLCSSQQFFISITSSSSSSSSSAVSEFRASVSVVNIVVASNNVLRATHVAIVAVYSITIVTWRQPENIRTWRIVKLGYNRRVENDENDFTKSQAVTYDVKW